MPDNKVIGCEVDLSCQKITSIFEWKLNYNTTNIALMFDITQTRLDWVTVCPSFRLSHIINWAHHDNGNQAPVDISHLFTPKKKMRLGGLTANVRSSWLKCTTRQFLSFFFFCQIFFLLKQLYFQRQYSLNVSRCHGNNVSVFSCAFEHIHMPGSSTNQHKYRGVTNWHVHLAKTSLSLTAALAD